jgi:hypothetical protein
MKLLNKQEFLVLLKEIITVLENENIKFDIPFSYINKLEFNYINEEICFKIMNLFK